MNELQRQLKREAAKARKLEATGLKTLVCVGCGSDEFMQFELDHTAGRKHDDALWPLCKACHHQRTMMQREQPPPTLQPRNVFEIIGRWLLAMAEYFEMLVSKLRDFGEFLIDLARQGYGNELQFSK